jgi:hypothetical protein
MVDLASKAKLLSQVGLFGLALPTTTKGEKALSRMTRDHIE